MLTPTLLTACNVAHIITTKKVPVDEHSDRASTTTPMHQCLIECGAAPVQGLHAC